MLKLSNKDSYVERNADLKETVTFTSHDVTGSVKLAMDSIWDYTGPEMVNVDSIQIIETLYEEDGDTSVMVNVSHDATWDIYTDNGFERAISEALGFEVSFTEQGMHANFLASMETD